jgi:hypothetical protein
MKMKRRTLLPRKITTKLTPACHAPEAEGELGGWLHGKRRTYLWFGTRNGRCLGTLEGQKLLRLARVIVKEMEK